MAYYAVIEPPRSHSFTANELEQNISAIYQWREFIQHLLKRSFSIQLFTGEDGIFIRLTDYDAYVCLIGDNTEHQISREMLPLLNNSLSETHSIELSNWQHRQRQRLSSIMSSITADTSIAKEKLDELVLEVEVEQDFVNTRTSLPYLYYLKSYDPVCQKLVHQTETVSINGEKYVITSVRDDLLTIAIEHYPNRYLEYVNVPGIEFASYSDKLTYYKNVIPWEAIEFIEELLDEMDMHPERTFLSITGLSDNAKLLPVDQARHPLPNSGEHPNVLYIPRLSNRWNEERIIELLKFFDPTEYQKVVLKWWLSYESNSYYMSLTLVFPPGSRAWLFKYLFSPMTELPPSDADYKGDFNRVSEGVDCVYYYHPRLTKSMISEYDMFQRLYILDLGEVSYSNLQKLINT